MPEVHPMGKAAVLTEENRFRPRGHLAMLTTSAPVMNRLEWLEQRVGWLRGEELQWGPGPLKAGRSLCSHPCVTSRSVCGPGSCPTHFCAPQKSLWTVVTTNRTWVPCQGHRVTGKRSLAQSSTQVSHVGLYQQLWLLEALSLFREQEWVVLRYEHYLLPPWASLVVSSICQVQKFPGTQWFALSGQAFLVKVMA